jgi:predicted dehydrogenase
MIGGGEGAFIGAVHRMAARLDGRYQLVAGVFSSDAEKTKRSAVALGVDPARAYPSVEAMIAAEKQRPDGIEVVSIVTPNHVHYVQSATCLEAGLDVICDKPLTTNLADAVKLVQLAASKQRLLGVTFNYSGYPMIRHAKQLIADGLIGNLRVVQVEYPQGWLSTALEKSGQKQASWRTDPKQAGAGALGDIGSHAFQLAEFVTGAQVSEVAADVSALVPGRVIDDNVNVLLRFANGARGSLWASQVAIGHLNSHRLRVYGDAGPSSGSRNGLKNCWSWNKANPRVACVAAIQARRRVRSGCRAAIPKASSRRSRSSTRTSPSASPRGSRNARRKRRHCLRPMPPPAHASWRSSKRF